MNFASGLFGLAAFQQGMQQDQAYQRAQEFEKIRLQQLKSQISVDEAGSQQLYDYLANLKDNAPQLQLGPPPKDTAKQSESKGEDSTSGEKPADMPYVPQAVPSAQPPAPGQPSVPMMQPYQAAPNQANAPIVNAGPVPTTNGPGPSWQVDPAIQARRQQQVIEEISAELQTEQDPRNRQALQRELTRLTGVPPYQSLNGVPGGGGGNALPVPSASPQGLPPPPAAVAQQARAQQMPKPNSMSLEDAASFLKSKGVSDPRVAMNMLGKLQPFLNNEAKAQAQMLGLQVKQDTLEERIRHEKEMEKATEDRIDAMKKNYESLNKDRETRDKAYLMNAYSKQMSAQAYAQKLKSDMESGKNTEDPGIEAAAWNYIIKGQNPPARGNVYKPTMARVEQIAKENGMTTEQLITASADVKTKLAAKKAFETRVQNVTRAENMLDQEIPVLQDAMAKLDMPKQPDLGRLDMWALRKQGDPRVTTLDQAAETVFNEFQGIITGNPGTLNVQDVNKAKEDYYNAQSSTAMQAAIDGMKRIIANAKKANVKTRDEIMQDISSEFHPKGEKATSEGGGSLPESAKAQLKKGEIKTFRNGQKWTLDNDGNAVQVK